MNFRELRCLKITDRRLVIELKDFDIRGLPSPEFLFIDMESLIKIPEDFKIGKYISSIEGIFSDCHSLVSIPKFDTSYVKNMNLMCYNCKSIKEIPELDTSNIESMDNSFNGCENLKSIILNISNLKTAFSIFKGCTKLKSIIFTGEYTKFNGTIDLTDIQLSYTSLIRLLKSLPEYKNNDYYELFPTLELSNMKSADKLSLDDISLVYNKGWRINKKGELKSER